jgi:alkylation response protein AidB-like acyl-CoA dehydrogenase
MPLTRVRELGANGVGFEPDWRRRGIELGWDSMTVGPAAGGDSISGEGLADTCIVAEETGRLTSPGHGWAPRARPPTRRLLVSPAFHLKLPQLSWHQPG